MAANDNGDPIPARWKKYEAGLREHAAQNARADMVARHLSDDDALDLQLRAIGWYLRAADRGVVPSHQEINQHHQEFNSMMQRLESNARARLEAGNLRIGIAHIDGPNGDRHAARRDRKGNDRER